MTTTAPDRDTFALDVRAVGTSRTRVEGPEKVTGRATYAMEHAVEDALHGWMVTSTVAKGRIRLIDPRESLAHTGVVAVLDHANAPRLADTSDRELAVLQDDRIGFRGQVVACVLAETPEAARRGAELVRVEYDEEPHTAELRDDSPASKPDAVNPDYPADSNAGRVDLAMKQAAHTVEETYRTPYEHNNPLEPHAVIAQWQDSGDDARLTLHASTQGVHGVARTVARLFGLEPEQVRVLSRYVGGGFGSKGLPHCQDVVAALAARTTGGRPVKLAVTRQQMFALTGYRTATIQHLRLGADEDGRLLAVDHRVLEQTSAIKEFAEQTGVASRMMYAAPNRHTSHRLVELDVAVPSWMRAPGEMPGMYALEAAMDELAEACGLDPIELRVRNDHDVDPESGKPFNDRRLVECLRRGAELFGWAADDREPRSHRDGDWWVGTGVASSTYPAYLMPGNKATVRALGSGRYAVEIGAADIGTGSWTVLGQIAADALEIDVDSVEVRAGDTDYPSASVAGGSSGTSSWGSAIVGAVRAFRAEHGDDPPPGAESTGSPEDNPDLQRFAMHSFGAQFAEVRVHRLTGELRVPRMLGVFSAGRIVNPLTARSQLLGGMTMGLSAALFEESWRDARFGHIVTQDLASYHIAAHADVADLQAHWLEEHDLRANPMGSRGIGELGIVGAAAAVANAAYNATGVRVRRLPVTADSFLG